MSAVNVTTVTGGIEFDLSEPTPVRVSVEIEGWGRFRVLRSRLTAGAHCCAWRITRTAAPDPGRCRAHLVEPGNLRTTTPWSYL